MSAEKMNRWVEKIMRMEEDYTVQRGAGATTG